MRRPKIVVDDAVLGWQAAFGGLGEVVGVPAGDLTPTRIADADALIVRTVTRVDATWVEGSSLKFVGTATTGVDHIDVTALERHGVEFHCAEGCNARAVAEWTLVAVAEAEAAGWDVSEVGVVGLGRIGARVVELLEAWGLRTRVCDPHVASPAGRKLESLAELTANCPVLTLHVPLVEQGVHPTRDLVGAHNWPGLLVNTSRGDCVSGVFGAAILDVWRGEPSLEWELLRRESPVLFASPHVAGYTLEAKVAATRSMHAALARHLGVVPTWDGEAILRSRSVPKLGAGVSRLDALRLARDLRGDDQALRELLANPEDKRARGFEQLRRDYGHRREFSAYTTDRSDLRSLGFGTC